MQQSEVINILKNDLNFNDYSIEKLKKFTNLVLRENKKHNLIAKSTENQKSKHFQNKTKSIENNSNPLKITISRKRNVDFNRF